MPKPCDLICAWQNLTLEGRRNERSGRRKAAPVWLHLEVDSTVARAEKEELTLLLNGGCSRCVHSQSVLCLDVKTWRFSQAREVCFNADVTQGLLRHGSREVNVYSWAHVVLSISMAGGVRGNPKLDHKWGEVYGRCNPLPPAHLPRGKLCRTMLGAGPEHWRGLFQHVGAIVNQCGYFDRAVPVSTHDGYGMPKGGVPINLSGCAGAPMRPHAIVLANGAHAYRGCKDPKLYSEHVSYVLRSLRREVVYDGALVWRTTQPPQYSKTFHGANVPFACNALANVTALMRAVRAVASGWSVRLAETAPIVDGWANGTVDGIHFDGGVLRHLHARGGNGGKRMGLVKQPVSVSLLGRLLQVLRDDSIVIGEAAALVAPDAGAKTGSVLVDLEATPDGEWRQVAATGKSGAPWWLALRGHRA